MGHRFNSKLFHAGLTISSACFEYAIRFEFRILSWNQRILFPYHCLFCLVVKYSIRIKRVQINHLYLILNLQSNGVKSSNAMELEGLKRGLEFSEDHDLTVCELITDRHIQVKRYLKDEYVSTYGMSQKVNNLWHSWNIS